jgi:hypothetical protein
MKTKEQLITELKKEYPTLNRGEDAEIIALTPTEYEATISQWADAMLEHESELAKSAAAELAKIDAIAKLSALGIDPKVLGLQVDNEITNGAN